jgi:hypothetical protein
MKRTVAAAVLLLTACDVGMVPNVPLQLRLRDPRVAYEAALTTVRQLGYLTVERDDMRAFFRVQAKLDGDVAVQGFGMYTTAVRRVSYFEVQVTSDGGLEIQAAGYHAHDGQIHQRLDEEMQRLGQAIEVTARRYSGAR